jgi:hypothetical protein
MITMHYFYAFQYGGHVYVHVASIRVSILNLIDKQIAGCTC